MSPDVIGLLLGILFVLPTLYVIRNYGWDQIAWPLILISLPGHYMLFGVLAGDVYVILLELLYGLPFIVLGLLCWKLRLTWMVYVVAIAWLAHGIYDFAHDQFFVNPGVFSWYPAFCALIDVVVAGYLFAQAGRIVAAQSLP